MYIFQKANVRWNGSSSTFFKITSWVKQGAVLSAILYWFYSNDLFCQLKKNKVGCWIQGIFFGAMGYADDNILISPSREGLQNMVDTCQEYANAWNLQFSTDNVPKKSKTKCMAFLAKPRAFIPIKLNGKDLPWVDRALHLGNTFENQINGMQADILIKRAISIQQNLELIKNSSMQRREQNVI